MSKSKDSKHDEAQVASFWAHKFNKSIVAKSDYTKRWTEYLEAYNGEYFKNTNLPEYRSDLVSNYIFSTIETIRPIMLDNDPKFQVMPRTPDGVEFANDLQNALSYEWDRDGMNVKLYKELITTLVLGTSVAFMHWDSDKKEATAKFVSPFNIFPDPLATGIDDAEYIIYASYQNAERLKREFPSRSDLLIGGDINHSELVHDNDKDATIDNQILVLEVWTRGYETFSGDPKEDDIGKERVITICPDLGIVLSDKGNPYKDKDLPFRLLKDYDIPGKFWGEGEIAQLISPQKHMNDLNNSILDNAKMTANMPWIVDKNSGIKKGSITSRPGLIIRKNPGTEVRREQPPSLPAYVQNTVDSYKGDIEHISGIYNSLRGESETGVYTAQGILALQEAGQARVRLKVKLMEDFLGEVATLWYSRIKQFWVENRFIRTVKPTGDYDFTEYTRKTSLHDYDIRIMAGSTMPTNRGAMLDLMIRLAQTQMPDGETVVDRESVLEYLPAEIKSSILRRMEDKTTPIEAQIMELTEFVQVLGQELEEITMESRENDEGTFDVIEEITGTLEEVNGRILQLQEEYDRMRQEQEEESRQEEIVRNAYNEGYSDAGELENYDDIMGEEDPMDIGMFDEEVDALEPFGFDDEGDEEPELTDELGINDIAELPDDILEGIENLSDEELRLLLRQYPQLADLIR